MSAGPRAQQMGAARRDERGLALVVVIALATLVTLIGMSVVGIMHSDMSHASIQNAVTRAFYIAQAGLEEAKNAIMTAVEPDTFATPVFGVQQAFGGGSFTYWVDAGPATGCGTGIKTIESLGTMGGPFLRQISARVRACVIPKVPFGNALFGVQNLSLESASDVYLAPYQPGAPGIVRGPDLASFSQIIFQTPSGRLNELKGRDLTLRDGRIKDYQLFGFSSLPAYESDPGKDPEPWILSVFGDIVKAQPVSGPVPNVCGTPYACVTVQGDTHDIQTIGELREDYNIAKAYMNRMVQATMPDVSLNPDDFRTLATSNVLNTAINAAAGLPGKTNSVYTPTEFDKIVTYLKRNCPPLCLQGTAYVDGDYALTQSVDMSGNAGTLTLAVRGDLVLQPNVALTIRHDLTSVAGRKLPGLVVLGQATPGSSQNVCGSEDGRSAGRLILCGGSSKQALTIDGLLYTADGMALRPNVEVDIIGAAYNGSRTSGLPSFSIHNDSEFVIRWDPFALTAFKQGLLVLSWQQLQ